MNSSLKARHQTNAVTSHHRTLQAVRACEVGVSSSTLSTLFSTCSSWAVALYSPDQVVSVSERSSNMCTKTNSQQCDSLDLGSSQNRGTLDSWSGAADWRRDAFYRCQPALGSSTPRCNRLLVFRASWRHVGTTNCNQTQWAASEQRASEQRGKCYSGYEKSAGGHRFLSNYPLRRVLLFKHCSNPHNLVITIYN